MTEESSVSMTEENFTELKFSAEKIVNTLLETGYPKNSSSVPEWLKKVKLLQAILSVLWQKDATGKLMVETLNFLYGTVAGAEINVSPAVWSVLNLVEKDKISEFVEEILSNPERNDDLKIKNVLVAMIEGLGQCGPYTPKLQDWIFAMVRGLETKEKYSILIEVSENVIVKLTHVLMIPLYRPLIYPVFKQFLYPVITSHVFCKILNVMPRVVNVLYQDYNEKERDSLCSDFAELIKIMLARYSPKSGLETKFKILEISLMKFSETSFNNNSMKLWIPKEKKEPSLEISEKKIIFENSTFPLTPYKGLLNKENICFMNSILQILYMTTRFRKELLEKEIDPNEKAVCDLQLLFALMQESDRPVLVPNEMIKSTLPPTFRQGHDQDCSEYLIYLLDIVHESQHRVIQKKKQKDKNSETEEEGNGDFEESETSSESEEETFVEKLFGGVIKSTIACSFCNKSFPKREHFRYLYLSIFSDYKVYELQELLDMNLEPEELCNDDKYSCANCGVKRNATRKQFIVKAPEHLILSLKLFRFDPVKKQRLKLYSRLKNLKSIQLPVYNSDLSQKHLVKYELKGCVLHNGSTLDGGHYFSLAIDETGQWYVFNDATVTPIESELKLNFGGTPYVLIFRQKGICDPPKISLTSKLQILVHKDNEKFLIEKNYRPKKNGFDDWDDAPPSSGSLGGPGSSLFF